jgi:hypothetical protein
MSIWSLLLVILIFPAGSICPESFFQRLALRQHYEVAWCFFHSDWLLWLFSLRVETCFMNLLHLADSRIISNPMEINWTEFLWLSLFYDQVDVFPCMSGFWLAMDGKRFLGKQSIFHVY